MTRMMLILALSAGGCDQGVAPKAKAKATVMLTSVAFADDCGGTPPSEAPLPAQAAMPAKPSVAQERVADEAAVRRRCEQTAMQLAIVGAATTQLRIKSVEVFDPDGKSLGTLTASKPTRWADTKAAYEPWDENVAAGQTSRVSYVLSQPVFVDRYDSRDRTYTVKVVADIGGVDQPLQTTVMVVGMPAPVPT